MREVLIQDDPLLQGDAPYGKEQLLSEPLVSRSAPSTPPSPLGGREVLLGPTPSMVMAAGGEEALVEKQRGGVTAGWDRAPEMIDIGGGVTLPKSDEDLAIMERRQGEVKEAYNEAIRRDPGMLTDIAQFFGGDAVHPVEAYAGLKSDDPYERQAATERLLGSVLDLSMWSKAGAFTAKAGLSVAGQLGGAAAMPLIGLGKTKTAQVLGDKAWRIVSAPADWKLPGEFGKSFFAGKSAAELLQPAVERMPKRWAETFRRKEAWGSLLTEGADELASGMSRLGPKGLEEMTRWMGRELPLKNITDPEARFLAGRMKGRMKDAKLDKFYEEEFASKVGDLYRKMMGAKTGKPFYNATASQAIQGIQAKARKGGGYDLRSVREGLEGIILDPGQPEEVVQYAKSLYNVTAKTPSMVAEGINYSNRSWIMRKILNRKGTWAVVDDTAREGFELAPKKEWVPESLRGLYVDRNVLLELEASHLVPELSRSWTNRWLLGPWKSAKVLLRPAAHFRNMMSNLMLNDIGGLPFYRGDMYVKAYRDMRQGAPAWKEFKRLVGAGQTFGQHELQELGHFTAFDAGPLDKAMSLFDKVTKPTRQIYSAEEQVFKFAKYLHNREQGMLKNEAAWDAVKWTFNYGEITPMTAAIRSNAAPFFTWTSKVLPLMAEATVKHPLRVGKWAAFYAGVQAQAIESVGLSKEEYEGIKKYLPEYMQKGLFLLMPFRDSQNRLVMADMTYIIPGFGDIAEMTQNGFFENLFQMPWFSIPSALATNTKHTGEKIAHEWEPWDTQLMKQLSYGWEQIMPSWAGVPGGIGEQRYFEGMDWRNAREAWSQVPGAMTLEQAIAAQFGIKLKGVDPELAMNRFISMQKLHKMERDVQMQRELRKATTPEEVQKIISRYQFLEKEATERVQGKGNSAIPAMIRRSFLED